MKIEITGKIHNIIRTTVNGYIFDTPRKNQKKIIEVHAIPQDLLTLQKNEIIEIKNLQ